LDILFASKALEKLCHDDKLATRTMGASSARKLRIRLDDLIAATTLDYMRKLPGRFHGLSGDRAGQFSIELDGGCRLVFEPANAPLPAHREQKLDISKVTAIRVVYVGDYHG